MLPGEPEHLPLVSEQSSAKQSSSMLLKLITSHWKLVPYPLLIDKVLEVDGSQKPVLGLYWPPAAKEHPGS